MEHISIQISDIRKLSLNNELKEYMLSENTLKSIAKIHKSLDEEKTSTEDIRGGGWNRGNKSKGNGTGQSSGYRSFSQFANNESSNNDRKYKNDVVPDTDGWSTVPVSTGRRNQNASEHHRVHVAVDNTKDDSGSKLKKNIHYPSSRYVSIFKPSETEHVDDTIMNTIIRGKLNKFNSTNYIDIRDFMCQILDSGQTDFLKQFMLFVFQKATTEEFFCPLYATLLSELSIKYESLKVEMNFLIEEYLNVFKEIDHGTDGGYTEFLNRNGQKKYRLGYSQFLSELVKHESIDKDLFLKTVCIIIEQVETGIRKENTAGLIEEYIDCLLRIAKSFNSNKLCTNINEFNIHFKKLISSHIEKYILRDPLNIGLSNRGRFTIMELCDEVKK